MRKGNKITIFYLGEDAVYDFINSMAKESNYCSGMMKKYLDDSNFENSTKCWICDVYVDGNVKVNDHYHITKNYKGSWHRDCNINIKINHKLLLYSTTLKIVAHILLSKN